VYHDALNASTEEIIHRVAVNWCLRYIKLLLLTFHYQEST